MEDNKIIEEFNNLKQKEQELTLKKVELETNKKSVLEKYDSALAKVKELGLNSEEELKEAYDKEYPEIKKQLEEAFKALNEIENI